MWRSGNLSRSIKHGFIKARSYLTNLTVFYDTNTGLLNEGRTMNADFAFIKSSTARTLKHSIFIDNLMCGLDKRRMAWIENWLNSWTQKVLTCGTKPSLLSPRSRHWNSYYLSSSLVACEDKYIVAIQTCRQYRTGKCVWNISGLCCHWEGLQKARQLAWEEPHNVQQRRMPCLAVLEEK